MCVCVCVCLCVSLCVCVYAGFVWRRKAEHKERDRSDYVTGNLCIVFPDYVYVRAGPCPVPRQEYNYKTIHIILLRPIGKTEMITVIK